MFLNANLKLKREIININIIITKPINIKDIYINIKKKRKSYDKYI